MSLRSILDWLSMPFVLLFMFPVVAIVAVVEHIYVYVRTRGTMVYSYGTIPDSSKS